MKSSPYSQQVEKAHVQQQRLSETKNKNIKEKMALILTDRDLQKK